MTPAVNRGTPASNAYLDLRGQSRRLGRPFEELLTFYVLEGFLARLATSPYADRFVLKGGVLLAAYGQRRPTRDIDLAARAVSTKPADLATIVDRIIRTRLPVDDGLVFDVDATRTVMIREGDVYGGLRLTMPVALATGYQKLSLDISAGDPIDPPAEVVEVPRVLGGAVRLRGYPVEMVIAEKLVTAVQRGTANTRWRDLADVLTLLRHERLNGDRLTTATVVVAHHRGAALGPLGEVLGGYADAAGPRWEAWRRTRERTELPLDLDRVVDELATFADGVFVKQVAGRHWNPSTSAWV